INQVTENPQVEICFVDRKMWYARITGKAQISENRDHKQILWDAIPMLKQYFGGVEDPNFKLMEIEISHIEAMTPHQKEPESVAL
ncbi:MAG: pyridoxamine 5'-phosphate oxidase family protein, partial [Candidatus Omnitrophica bacterium]|nr:pyridoxamine 5'-phosphate oxidase family protein [Candidatus Omnitrophota bacterium]